MSTTAFDQPVLVLNKSWTPLNTVTMKRALKMVIKGRAKVVNPADFRAMTWEDWSRIRPGDDAAHFVALGQRFCLPEVIVLQEYDRVPQPRAHFSRRALFKRDHYRCQYCGHQLASENCTIDHVIPRSQGGMTSWENCVISCVACNAKKANRTPRQADMKLRSVPAKPKYPLFRMPPVRIESWAAFVSEVYWSVPLTD